VPVPAEDVELIAPQITHFGLDTLGIEVLGTSGWADAQTLARVDPRHTNDVVATAPIGGLPGSPGYERFREAYESHFRRSLVSGVPALGYDAALVLLRALADRSPLVTVSGPTPGLDLRREVEGATGVFTLQDGRIVRRTGVFRIRDRTLNPIPTG